MAAASARHLRWAYLLIGLAAPAWAGSGPNPPDRAPAAGGERSVRYMLDSEETTRAVYESFRGALHLQQKTAISGESPHGGIATVEAVDAEGIGYVIDEHATRGGAEHVIRRKPSLPVKQDASSVRHRIDGKLVWPAVYDAFRKSLKAVPHTWFCAEDSDGGMTGLDGVASDGHTYQVREHASSKAGSDLSIRRVPAPAPGRPGLPSPPR